VAEHATKFCKRYFKPSLLCLRCSDYPIASSLFDRHDAHGHLFWISLVLWALSESKTPASRPLAPAASEAAKQVDRDSSLTLILVCPANR
jgi:hypothetical protein